MSIPKTLVSEREEEQSTSSARMDTAERAAPSESGSDVDSAASAPSTDRKKTIRWKDQPVSPDTSDASTKFLTPAHCGMPSTTDLAAAATAGQCIMSRLDKMREHRKRKAAGAKAAVNTVEECQAEMRRMEQRIQKAAKLELALMNKSKKIREHRQILMARYEKLGADVDARIQAQDPTAPPTKKVKLPPMFKGPSSSLTHHTHSAAYVDLTD